MKRVLFGVLVAALGGEVLAGVRHTTPAASQNGMVMFGSVGDNQVSALWKTNGGDGRVKVKNVEVFEAFPGGSAFVGDTFYFSGRDSSGSGLWKSDGTEAGTVLVKPLSSISRMVAFGGNLLFVTSTPESGTELWRSNGTAEGTVLVKDIRAGVESSSPSLDTSHAMAGSLYFFADDGVHGTELWKTDGTAAGTQLVKDINAGAGSSSSGSDQMNSLNNKLYFSAGDSVSGEELWVSDGTAEGTKLFKEFSPLSTYGNSSLIGNKIVFANALYFEVCPSDFFEGCDLWKTDGTEMGTVKVKDFEYSGGGTSYPGRLQKAGEKLVFSGHDSNLGTSLIISDGTASGTVAVHSIMKGWRTSGLVHMRVAGSSVFFQGYSDTAGYELWRLNANTGLTALVMDINPGTGSTDIENPIAYGNKLIFSADNGTTGRDIYVTDGSSTKVMAESTATTPPPPPPVTPPPAGGGESSGGGGGSTSPWTILIAASLLLGLQRKRRN